MQCKRWFLTGVLVIALAFVGCGDKETPTKTGEGDPAKAGPAGGSAAAPKADPVPADLAALVPSNAMALVYVRAPAELEGKVQQMVGMFDADAVAQIQLKPMIDQMMMGAGEHWDPSMPMAIAVPLPGADQEMDEAFEGVAMIFGMKDANAAKEAMEAAFAKQMEGVPEKYQPKPEDRPQFLVSGKYLTMSRGTPGKRGGAKIAATAPSGDLGLRIDLASIVERFRKDIDEGLGEMEKGLKGGMGEMPPGMESLGGMLEGIAGFARDFINSAETLDIGMSVDQGSVELAFGFVAKEGSALDKPSHDHAGLGALAAHLPADLPVNLLMSMDMGALMEWMKPLMQAAMEQMPEADKAKFKAYMEETTEMSKLIGPNWAVGVAMGDKGLELVEVVESKDAATYIQRVGKLFEGDMLSAMPGIDAKKAGSTKVAGVDVHTYELRFDFEELMKMQGQSGDLPPKMRDQMDGIMKMFFGGDAMKMHMATVDNKLLMTMGGEERMAAAIESVRQGGGKAPPALQSGLDKTGGMPTFLLNIDVRQLASQIVPMIAKMTDQKMPAVPAGGPIPVMVWGKHDGRVYGGGLKVDVGGIVEMVEAMDK